METGAVGVGAVLTAEKAEGRVSDGLSPVPGLAVSQATHFTASGLFITRHVSQSQVPAGLENIAPKPVVVVVVEEVAALELLLLSSPTEVVGEGLLSIDLDEEELGCGAAQQTHFASDGLFCTKHTSQLQPFSGALNKSPNPVEEEREEVVVEVEEGAVDCVEFGWGALSGPGEVRATGEPKPKGNRRGMNTVNFQIESCKNIQASKKHSKIVVNVSVIPTWCFEKIQHAALLQDLGWFKGSLIIFCAFVSCWLHCRKHENTKVKTELKFS